MFIFRCFVIPGVFIFLKMTVKFVYLSVKDLNFLMHYDFLFYEVRKP